jgi:hypothetical protein
MLMNSPRRKRPPTNIHMAGWLVLLVVLILWMPCQADMKGDFVNPPLKFRSRPLWFWNNTAVYRLTSRASECRGSVPFAVGSHLQHWPA